MLDVAQISQWLGKLKQGALTAADLEQALEQLKQGRVLPAVLQTLCF